MATNYGNFEVIKELFKTGQGSVCCARWSETKDSPHTCLKVVELNESMLEEHDTVVAEELLVSAALQQTMANKSEFWAPVYELGSNGTNAYYAGKLYPRSLQTLVDKKTRITTAELKTILIAVIDGLIDLNSAYHRQHGNLKPANVLLRDSARIASDGIYLADPDAIGDPVASLSRVPDTKALGQILYSLVTHKPTATARLPLPRSEHWKNLGSSGTRWFALCESLLDTFSQRTLPTLESIRLRVGEIRPSARRVPRSVLVALFFMATGASAYWYRAQLGQDWQHSRFGVSGLASKYLPQNLPIPAEQQPIVPARSSVAQSSPTTVSPSTQPDTAVSHPAAVLNTSADIAVITAIKSAATPELHSLPAEQQFEHDRDTYLKKHQAPAAPANLVQWHAMYQAIQNLDLQYPQPQGFTSAPISLSDELTARRDVELTSAVDAIFNQDNADPSLYTTELSDSHQVVDAGVAGGIAMAGADLGLAESSIKKFQQKVESLEAVDATAAAAFNPVQKEFGPFIDARTSTDRAALMIASDDQTLPLAIRIRSWLRLSKTGGDIWPADLPALAADRAQCDRLAQLSKDVPATQQLIATEQANRLAAFFASMHDEAGIHEAIRQSSDLQLTEMAPLYPLWFQYDIALAQLKDAKSLDLTPDQITTFLSLADKVHAPNATELRAAFTAIAEPVKTLATVGPAGAVGWKLAPGSDVNHRAYILGDQTLEFLRVQQPIGTSSSQPIDCYLGTTEVPISLLQTILDKFHPEQRQAAQALNTHQTISSTAMALWSFASDGIKLDDRDYKNCFLLAPTRNLPAQFVTPEMAMYVARLVGCRLPTSDEWHAALAQVTQPSADPYQWGFAMRNWKLRDADFLAAMNHAINSKPPQYWPDDNIFRDFSQVPAASHAQDTQVWSPMNLAALAGHIAPVPNMNGDDALPMAPGHLGFREVDDGAHYTGVFHNLIGNAAEIVLDVQASVAESLDINDNPADQIKNWFSPDRQAHVAIIGGSALSPPSMDPRTAYPLPPDSPLRAFADVGFRLAFSNPQAASTRDPAKLRAIAIDHAPLLSGKNAE